MGKISASNSTAKTVDAVKSREAGMRKMDFMEMVFEGITDEIDFVTALKKRGSRNGVNFERLPAEFFGAFDLFQNPVSDVAVVKRSGQIVLQGIQ